MYWKSPSVTGRTFSVVVRVSAKRKSLQVNRNVNSPAVISALRLIGITMEKNARMCPAPSTLAASMIGFGMVVMNARMIRIANGMPWAESARIRPGDGVEQAEVVVGGVEGVGDHDARDHLADQDPEEDQVGAADLELRQRVRRRRGDEQAEDHTAERDDQAGHQVAALLADRRPVTAEVGMRGKPAGAQGATRWAAARR